MKKILFITLFFSGMLMGAHAQSTKEIRGFVIDKNGNPIPGAKVQATGGAEMTVTDADGTFSMEVSKWLKSLTATYPGMKSKKAKLKEQNAVIIKLTKNNNQWFVQGIAQYEWSHSVPSLGVMGGMLGNWGWYGKAVIDLTKPSKSGYESYVHGISWSASGGVVKHLYDKFYLYAGAGLGSSRHFYTHSITYSNYISSDFLAYSDLSFGLILDAGLIYQYKKLNFNIGFSYSSDFDHLFYAEEFDNYSFSTISSESTRTWGNYYLRIGAGYTF